MASRRLASAHAHLAALLLEAARAFLVPFPAELGGGLLVTGVALGAALDEELEVDLRARHKAELVHGGLVVSELLVARHQALDAFRHEGLVLDHHAELLESACLVKSDGGSLARGGPDKKL